MIALGGGRPLRCLVFASSLAFNVSAAASQDRASGARVCVGGDVMIGSDLDTTWVMASAARISRHVPALPDFANAVAPLGELARDADILVINVEGAIGSGSVRRKCREGSQNCYAFRQPPAAATAIRNMLPRGFVVGNLANNHAMDAGSDGFAETAGTLSDAGAFVTGVDTLATLVPLPQKGTVAILGFSTAQAGPDPRDLPAVRRHVRRAEGVADWVVVTMHMGGEGAGAQRTRDATEMFLGENRGNPVAFAHAAVEAGADLVIGHGPHVLRAAEWWEGTFIGYSLGNLLTYGPFNLDPPRDSGGLVCTVFGASGDGEVELRSTKQVRPGTVAHDPSSRAVWLVDSLSALDFPTTGAKFGPTGRATRPKP